MKTTYLTAEQKQYISGMTWCPDCGKYHYGVTVCSNRNYNTYYLPQVILTYGSK